MPVIISPYLPELAMSAPPGSLLPIYAPRVTQGPAPFGAPPAYDTLLVPAFYNWRDVWAPGFGYGFADLVLIPPAQPGDGGLLFAAPGPIPASLAFDPTRWEPFRGGFLSLDTLNAIAAALAALPGIGPSQLWRNGGALTQTAP